MNIGRHLNLWWFVSVRGCAGVCFVVGAGVRGARAAGVGRPRWCGLWGLLGSPVCCLPVWVPKKKDTFDDDQDSSFADYIELALQLQFNERSRSGE